MKYITLTFSILCSTALYAEQSIQLKTFSVKDVVLENYAWTGELPKHRKIKIINHYGNIASRLRSEKKIGISAVIQKIGDQPAIPTFDIQEMTNFTQITVNYPNGQYNSDDQMIGRVDIAVIVPESVSVEMESTWGTIKSKKHFSNMSAKTISGNISLGSVGELNVESETGNISVDHYNINWHNPQRLYTEQGDIQLTLAKVANTAVSVQAKSITSNYYQKNIQSTAEESILSFTLNAGNSFIEVIAPQGKVSLDLIDKPHGAYIALPSGFDGDIRDLPTVPAWQPGDPIREQDDRRSSTDTPPPKDNNSSKASRSKASRTKEQ